MRHQPQSAANCAIADQFVGVYGPGGYFTLAPIVHITRNDARRLVRDRRGRWVNRGLGMQVEDVDIICQPGIMAFIMPGDLAEEEPTPEDVTKADDGTGANARDRKWQGAGCSLNPGPRVMHAAALRVFWARVIIGAWRGFMADTKGNGRVTVDAIPYRPLELEGLE